MLLGIVVLVTGLYFYFSTFGLHGLVNHNVLAYTYIAISIIGALSIVLGIVGECGAYHYSRCLLMFYSVLVLCIFAAEVTMAIVCFTHQEEVQRIIYETLTEGTQDLRNNPEIGLHWMDTIQIAFGCCGVNGRTDYLKLRASCCPNGKCTVKEQITSLAYPGCSQRVNDILQNFLVLCLIIFVIAFIELVGLIFALTLCCAAGNRNTYYEAVRTH